MKKEEVILHHPTPTTLIEKAIEKGTDMNQLKELMDLQERWEKKEARKRFFDALSQFQAKVPVLRKNKTAKVQMKSGGSFSYKYADLGTITSQIKNALNECGLSYRWEFAETGTKLKVTCILSHRDGHSESSSMEAGLDTSGSKNDIQQKGSTQTYLQRYTLIGVLGLSTADEDNDGRNHTRTLPEEEESYTDTIEQWKSSLAQVKTRAELQSLYLKNRKTVDGDKNIQALFKHKQDELKKEVPTEKVIMP